MEYKERYIEESQNLLAILFSMDICEKSINNLINYTFLFRCEIAPEDGYIPNSSKYDSKNFTSL